VALTAAVPATRDAPNADLAAAGIRKILDVLDPRTLARANELADRVWISAPPSASRAIRSAVEDAMADQRVVRIRYTSRDGETTTRDVEPVLFASSNGQWYLVGWCRLRDAMRWFTMSRVVRATMTTTACSGHSSHEVGAPPANARPVHGRTE
jgi:predicted DNA-binding transcriptional regulator YafY